MTNLICLVGAIPIGICGFYWNSKTMMLVSIVGVLFHLNPKNKFMYFLDLSLNSCLSIIACCYNKKIICLFLFSSICFIINNYLYYHTSINKNIINVQHVLFIQCVGLYGYYMIYSQELGAFV